jgi:cell division transport system permease protein
MAVCHSLAALKLFCLPAGKHTSYFYAVFGITLVLVVLGAAAVALVEVHNLATHFKENLNVEVVLKDSVTSAQIPPLQKALAGKHYVKHIRYISTADAAKILQKDLGDNFLDILGYNPLYASFVLNLRERFANKDSISSVQADISKTDGVQQVNVQKNMLESLDKTIQNASLIVFIIGGALLIFAVSLIFNTIRLVMFSNRFNIKTMQLFGATRWFIIRPFLGKSLFNGFISGAIACILIAAVLVYADYTLPELGLKGDLITFALLSGAVILFGILISFLSTLTAVLHYLRVKVEDLY